MLIFFQASNTAMILTTLIFLIFYDDTYSLLLFFFMFFKINSFFYKYAFGSTLLRKKFHCIFICKPAWLDRHILCWHLDLHLETSSKKFHRFIFPLKLTWKLSSMGEVLKIAQMDKSGCVGIYSVLGRRLLQEKSIIPSQWISES